MAQAVAYLEHKLRQIPVQEEQVEAHYLEEDSNSNSSHQLKDQSLEVVLLTLL